MDYEKAMDRLDRKIDKLIDEKTELLRENESQAARIAELEAVVEEELRQAWFAGLARATASHRDLKQIHSTFEEWMAARKAE